MFFFLISQVICWKSAVNQGQTNLFLQYYHTGVVYETWNQSQFDLVCNSITCTKTVNSLSHNIQISQEVLLTLYGLSTPSDLTTCLSTLSCDSLIPSLVPASQSLSYIYLDLTDEYNPKFEVQQVESAEQMFGHSTVFYQTQNQNRKYTITFGGFTLIDNSLTLSNSIIIMEIPFYATEFQMPIATSYPEIANGPTSRAFHSMIIQSTSYGALIYIYGGLDQNGANNEMWTLELSDLNGFINLQNWQLISQKGFGGLQRRILKWDGQEEDIIVINSKLPILTDLFLSSSDQSQLPVPRLQQSMTLTGNQLILLGGCDSKLNILNDQWVFDLQSQVWVQNFIDMVDQPQDFGGQLVQIQQLLFFYNQGLWQYSIKSLKQFPNQQGTYSDEQIDIQMNYNQQHWYKLPENHFQNGNNQNEVRKGHILVNYNNGFILHGGNYTIKENFLIFISKDKSCDKNQQSRGNCVFGQLQCFNQYWGVNCEFDQCQNSICLYDKYLQKKAECIHCSGNGDCINGNCICKSDMLSIGSVPCSIPAISCNSPYGAAVLSFPQSQCRCNLTAKRGGMFCEDIYCMNSCNGGICSSGVCACADGRMGNDCGGFQISIVYAQRIQTLFFILAIMTALIQ